MSSLRGFKRLILESRREEMETAAEWSRRFWYQAGVNDAKLAALLASLAAETAVQKYSPLDLSKAEHDGT